MKTGPNYWADVPPEVIERNLKSALMDMLYEDQRQELIAASTDLIRLTEINHSSSFFRTMNEELNAAKDRLIRASRFQRPS